MQNCINSAPFRTDEYVAATNTKPDFAIEFDRIEVRCPVATGDRQVPLRYIPKNTSLKVCSFLSKPNTTNALFVEGCEERLA